jgi:hypothetical protein
MDDLDDKILDAATDYSQGTSSNTILIEEIKDAFIKAGWTKPDPTRILGDE